MATTLKISRKTRRRHAAHHLSPGQGIARLAMAYGLGSMCVMMAYSSFQSASLPDLGAAWAVWPSQPQLLLPLVLSVLIGVLLSAGLLWACSRLMFTGARVCLNAMQRRLDPFLAMLRDVPPISDAERAGAVPMMLLPVAFIVVAGICLTLVAAPMLSGLPVLLRPLWGIAVLLVAAPLAGFARGLIDWRRAWGGWIRVIPALGRLIRNGLAEPQYCALCDPDSVDPGWLARSRRCASTLITRAADHLDAFASFAYMRRHPHVVILTVLTMLLLGWWGLSGGTLLDAFGLGTLLIIIATLRLGVSRGPSIFDGVVEPPSWKTLGWMAITLFAAVLLMGNVVAVRAWVHYVEIPITATFHAFDPDWAAATTLVFEAVVIYACYGIAMQRLGYKARWAPGEALRGGISTVLVCFASVIKAPTYLAVGLMMAAFVTAASKPFRDRYRGNRHAGAVAGPSRASSDTANSAGPPV